MMDASRRDFCRALAATGAAAALTRAPAAAASGGYPPVIGRLAARRTLQADTLADIARASGLGYTEIVAANPGVDPWLPGDGTEIVLPTAHILPDAGREGIVLNLADQRLYRFEADGVSVWTAPLGIGDDGWRTPTGATSVVRKARNPTWYVPKSVREDQPELPAVVRPGPDNPLGSHALYLGWPSYLIHGTNKPDGVGRRVSHGCLRLYPEDIAQLHDSSPVGTPVRIVDQEVKAAAVDGQLLVEVHPSQQQATEIEQTGAFTPSLPSDLRYRVLAAAGDREGAIDWTRVVRAARERRGTPIPVLKRSD